MRTFLSYFGFLLLTLALMLLGADLITTLEHGGKITLRSFLAVWAIFDADAVTAFTAWLNHTLPSVVAGGLIAVLSLPAWLIGFIGVPLGFIRKHEN